MKRNQEKKPMIERIVKAEWEFFDKTHNVAGRATCQDDWETFNIMRTSQYMTWSHPMLASYYQDLREYKEKGWNPISEKYARMMESTDPKGYEALKDKLPPISPERAAIIEGIVQLQVSFYEEAAEKYPKVAGRGRAIHTSEDTLTSTSYETYLRGELCTYSDRTLEFYGRFVAALCVKGQNLAEMILENEAMLYGYASLDELESKLK